jgi:hypothetical protein
MKVLASTAILALSPFVVAQPDPEPDPAPAPQAEALPAPHDVETIDEALARAIAAYQSGPIAEEVVITLSPNVGPDRTSTITLRVDAVPGSPRRLFIDLTRLAIAADDSQIQAQAPHAPHLTFAAPVSVPLTLPQLWNAVPPILLPQLEWALGSDPARLGRAITAILHTSWLPARYSETLSVIFQGESPGGPAAIEFNASGRLAALSIPLGREGPRLMLTVTPLDPEAGPWTLSAEGRTAVPSIADLRAKPAAVTPGARLPALSFMTRDLDAWSLQEALAQPQPGSPGPAFGLLIFYKADAPTAFADAQTGAKAAAEVADILRAAQPDPTRRPRTVAAVIALMGLGDMTRTRLAQADAQWPAPQPQRLFSPNGPGEMERLAPGSAVALLIIDAEQKLLAAIPLDQRDDVAAIAEEAVAAITQATLIP